MTAQEVAKIIMEKLAVIAIEKETFLFSVSAEELRQMFLYIKPWKVDLAVKYLEQRGILTVERNAEEGYQVKLKF